MRILIALAAVLGATACVGDTAELGGVTNRMTPPAEVVACDRSLLRVVQQGVLEFPADAMAFVFANQGTFSMSQAQIRYDINQEGETVNIAYSGPSEHTRHTTKAKVIKAAADTVQGTRYEWIGAPQYATGCTFDLTVEIRRTRYTG